MEQELEVFTQAYQLIVNFLVTYSSSPVRW